jgi:hypothetical protein
MNIGTATAVNVVVPAPVWWTTASINDDEINIEEGTTETVQLLGKAGGSVISGAKPVVKKSDVVSSDIKVTESTTAGSYIIAPKAGTSGTYEVSYNGAKFTVQVDNYSLTTPATTKIINKSDDQHKVARITLTNSNDAGTDATGKTITAATESTGSVTGLSTSTAGSGASAYVDVTASTVGNVKLTYNNASLDIEVVDFALTVGSVVDGIATVDLKKNGAAFDGASFKVIAADSGSVSDATKVSVKGTSGAGVYKVTSSVAADSGKKCIVQYWYKNVLVADVEVTLQ